MTSAPFCATTLVVDVACSGSDLTIEYVVDDRPPAFIAVGTRTSAAAAPAAVDLVAASAAIYLGALCLASEVRVTRALSPGLIDDLAPLTEMLYDIRRWKDDLPLGPNPAVIAPLRTTACLDRRPLDQGAAASLWSGGKDSTLALLTLRANGYRSHALHIPANVGVENAELAAVQTLSAALNEPVEILEFQHEDFLSISSAYAEEWDRFPLCNRVPFGRDLFLASLGVAFALDVGAANVSLGHDNECRTAEVRHRGKRVPRNDFESAVGALCFESAVRRHVHSGLNLLPPVANLSELRILRDMFVHHPELMAQASFCFWGGRCGRCAKCLRYFLADRLYGTGTLAFEANPLRSGVCPELRDHLDPDARSTLFQTEVLLMLGRLAARGDIAPGEDELERFGRERLPEIAPALNLWERDLLTERVDPQIPAGFLPLHREVPAA